MGRRQVLIDPAVIVRARAGDAAAFNQIVQACRKPILGTIRRLIGNADDVEDVAQEVFVRVYYSLDQLRSEEGFEAWLYRLTVNSAYDYLRRRKRRQESRMSDLAEEQVSIAEAAAGAKFSADEGRKAKARELAESLLSEVSEQDRMLLILKEVEGLSLKELERIYDVKENALKVRLFRARQRVLKAFEERGGSSSSNKKV
jgi:RNA polymerase sigma-70 factor, ECF subfamily